MLISIATYLYL